MAKTYMGEQISSSAPSLRWCSPTSYSMCHHSNSATMMMLISYFTYMQLIPHLNIMITVHSDIDGLASVSFNSLACQNFGIDFAKIIELSRSPHQQSVTTRSIKIESYVTAKINGLRNDLKVVRVWQYNDLKCTCLMVVSLWWCLMVVSLYFLKGLGNLIDFGK